MSLKILLTGSSGFLGIKLTEILSKSSNQVTGIDIKEPIKKKDNINYIKISINDYLRENKEDLNTYDLIIHAASVLPFKGKKDELYETNVDTSLNLIKEVSKLKDTFFIYVSSSGVYGKPLEIPVRTSTTFNPLDFYAETKITTEKNIENYLNINNYAIIRPRTIMGMNRKGIFQIFFTLIKYNIPIPLPNKGKQIIQFVDVADLAKLILYIGKNRIQGKWPAGASNPRPLREHLDMLGLKLDKRVLKFNINPTIFKIIGNIFISLKITSFTKWHFGAFPHDFYFDSEWKPKDFQYEFSNEETFLNSALTFFSKQ